MRSSVKAQKINTASYPPASLVQLLDPDSWESFIEDCCRVEMGAGKKYKCVQKLGGAGDAGRDIESRYIESLEEDKWDLYQGKFYGTAVSESVLYPELVKVIFHIGAGTYPMPKNYYICAPKNTTPKMHDLIARPLVLKEKFLEAWRKEKLGIGKKHPLTGATLDIAEKFDYSRIKEYLVKDLIALHSKDQVAHEKLFGVEAKRGANPVAPSSPTSEELVYISQLLKVYCEHAVIDTDIGDLFSGSDYKDHLDGCRGEFYSAEGLKRFSRDILPGEFENLLQSVLAGIKRTAGSPVYDSSFERLDEVLKAASALQIHGNPLSNRLFPADLPGACHHLVNEEKLKWVK